MENSRTRNVLRNISWSVFLQVILMFFQFFTRRIFVRQMGTDYLGVTGLFTDIFFILNLVNFGFPDAMVIYMYKPLAEKNYDKVRALLNFFRKVYSVMGIIILFLGILAIPLLKFIIRDPPNIPESLVKIYFLFLLQTVSTYFIVYKRYIIFTDQKDYIIKIYQKSFHFLQIVIQIVILLTIQNFFAYLSVQVICTILMNYFSSRKAEKMYPFINEKSTYRLSKVEISEILTNVKSVFSYLVGMTLFTAVDSILISSIIGIGVLGLCSNYMLIENSIHSLANQATWGFTASVGNLNVNSDEDTAERVFNQVNFVFFALLAFCSINLAVCFNFLIPVWLGDNFLLSNLIVISLVLKFYVMCSQNATYLFRSTLGLLAKMKYITIITAVANVILSIILGKIIGVAGIFLASSLSMFFFTIIPEAYIIYKYKFRKSSVTFFIRYFLYLLFMVCNYLVTSKILAIPLFNLIGWTGFFIKVIFSIIISSSLFFLVFSRNENFKSIISRLIYIFKSKVH